MNTQRAQEISVSPVMADVRWNGTPIYIQHVDAANEMARIFPLGRPDQEQEVPVRSLVEGGYEVPDVPVVCPADAGE
ncbi:H-type small acid-soluble spore protein [Paenibacillus sp. HJGM_3]|uniref:H-type small acid-soluble spore protein n=1 Tax=Paenibacillus sp. HJGM_3 TaxID=3379816 RepID=UPI003859FB1B